MIQVGFLGAGAQETQQSASKQQMTARWIVQMKWSGRFEGSRQFEAFGSDVGLLANMDGRSMMDD